MSSTTISATSLGVNNTSPSYALHVTGSGVQLGTLAVTTTNSTSTSVRAEIQLNDSSRSMTVFNNGATAFSIDSAGRTAFQTTMLNYCAAAVATASTSTTTFVTFPSAGVYFLFITQTSGTTSQTPELIDNLCKLFICICSTASNQSMQVVTLYNPNNGYFSISNIAQLSLGITVSSGTFTYRAFYQKIF